MDGPVRTRPAPSAAVEALWHLERVGPHEHYGWCRDGAPGRAFGGQVAAQALAAAGADLADGWHATSLRAHFVREGRTEHPIAYRVADVDAADEGVRLRRVTASQADRAILILDASFAVTGVGGGQLPPAPPRTDPGADPSADPSADSGAELGGWAPRGDDEERWLAAQSRRLRLELRFPDQPSRVAGRRGEVALGQRFWFRAVHPLPDEPLHHACALTYASDLFLVSTALATHGLPGRATAVQAASLDHAVWYHRAARADDWVLYEQTSPTSYGGRGLSTGRLLDRDGVTVATVHQEVLLRVAL